MKPGDRCPTCQGILIELDGKAHCARENKWWSDRTDTFGANEDTRPPWSFSTTITRALQGEPEAEVREASWKVDVKELGERFMKEGIPRG